MFLLMLYYFNWAGTPEKLKEFSGRMKSVISGTKGVEFNGIFISTSEWHYVLVMKATNYGKTLPLMKLYVEKFG